MQLEDAGFLGRFTSSITPAAALRRSTPMVAIHAENNHTSPRFRWGGGEQAREEGLSPLPACPEL